MIDRLQFTSRALLAWATAKGVAHILNRPSEPTQNAYIESFNGKFRDECLNEHWFETLAQARHEIAVWQADFNEVRPHASYAAYPHGSPRCIVSALTMQPA